MALWDAMEKFVNESVRVSREAYERAREVGSLTKKELELKNLQGKLQKEYAKLGGQVYRLLVEEKKTSISPKTAPVGKLLDAIRDLGGKIDAKKDEIASLRDGIGERRRQPPADGD